MDSFCEGCPFKGGNLVPSEIRPEAPIALIGEAPGAEEDKVGKPFQGSSGKLQDGIHNRAGLSRNDCSFLNVLRCRPPGNDIKTIEAQKAIALCTPRLLAELESLKKARVIVPVGNTALHAIGIRANIGSARGAIFDTPYGRTIPTWHPAYIMHQWQEYDTSIRDWKKIRRFAYGLNRPLPAEKFETFPTILQVEEFSAQIDALTQGEARVTLGVDIETYKGRPTTVPLKCIGFSTSESDAFVVPFITESGNYAWKTDDEMERAVMAVGRILENPRVEKIFHYGIFDISVLMNHGFRVVGPVFDTLLAHYLIYQPAEHTLAFVVSTHSDYPAWKLDKGGGDDFEFRRYNARDCVVMHMIKPALENEAKALGLSWLLDTLNAAVIPTARMAVNGIYFNQARRDEISIKLNQHINELQEEIETIARIPSINLDSPKQVGDLLFKTLKFRSGVKTSGGALSTNEDVLKKLVLRYPDSKIPDLILKYREASKLRGTYIDPPIGTDGRVHSTFSLHGTITGRFSSTEPDVQNLPNPVRDKTAFIRTLYAAPPGGVIVESDHSQVELRIFALLAHDIAWLQAFENGDDIHCLNMIDIYGSYEEQFRTFIKNFIYGLIYGSEGGEVEKVAPIEFLKKVKIPQALLNLYNKHPALLEYRNKQEKSIMERRKVINEFGRIRWFTSVPTKANIREGINFPITSVVSEVMHFHFPMLDRELDPERDKIILQLHDSYYVETTEARADTVAAIVKDVMESPVTAPSGMVFRFPVDQKCGPNMGEMRKLHA